MEWTSVEDRLPPEDNDDCVDVYSKSMGRLIDCSYIPENYWETYHGDKIDDATHWMPQPDPPKNV